MAECTPDPIPARVPCATCPATSEISNVPKGQVSAQMTNILDANFEVVRCLIDQCIIDTAADTRKEKQDTITFSATPAFDFDAETADNKAMTLTADVTSSTFAATRPGYYTLVLFQDGSGNWTYVFPGNVNGNPPQPDVTPSSTTVYLFYFDGTDFNF